MPRMSPRPLPKPYRRAPIGPRGDRTGHKGPRRRTRAAAPALDVVPGAEVPVVAIVGRPNVGKSTLVNAFARSLVSIVEPTPGVTRDRVSVLCTLAGRSVEIVDTGGIGIVDAQGLEPHVHAQVDAAIASADVIVFLVDAREGVVPLDRDVAERLRRAKAPVVLCANKAESTKTAWALAEFHALGYGEPLAISAQEGRNLDLLEKALGAHLPPEKATPPRLPDPVLSLAIVGRVNAGKSTFVNRLVREERMIVSEIPGTTRDSVDVRFERDGEAFVVIDTAGIRKERSVQNSLEFYAQRRAERAIRRADATALLLDATQDVARVDRVIAGYAAAALHPVIVVVNKWDRAPPGRARAKFSKYLRETLPNLAFAPVVFASATNGMNVAKVVALARTLLEQTRSRVATAEANRAVLSAYAKRRPRPYAGRVGKIYYATQVDVSPPTLLLFVDDPSRFPAAWTRYLENRLREMLPFHDVPLRIRYRTRERSPSKNLQGPLRE